MTKQNFDNICKIVVKTLENYNKSVQREHKNLQKQYQLKFFGMFEVLESINVFIKYSADEKGFYRIEIRESNNKFVLEDIKYYE